MSSSFCVCEGVIELVPNARGGYFAEFDRDTYSITKLALFNTGSDICVVCDDVLSVELEESQGVLMTFKYISAP